MPHITHLYALLRLSLAMVFTLGLFQPERPNGFSWYVATSGKDSNACNSPSKPCATIQGALNKAAAGDEIYIAAGVYKRSASPVVSIQKNITLSGGWDSAFLNQAGETIIDGESAHRVIQIEFLSHVVLEDLTLQNGYADDGAGIYAQYVDSLELRRLKLLRNHAESSGGGIYYIGHLATLDDSLVEENFAAGDGGGIFAPYDSGFEISYSTIRGNTCLFEGGGLLGGQRLVGSLVEDNSAGEEGGGIRLENKELYIEASTFHNNRSLVGGGLYGYAARVVNSTFSRNYSIDLAGAIYTTGQLKMLNTTLVENVSFIQGGGVFNAGSSIDLRNVTFFRNIALQYAGAIFNNGDISLRNSIFYDNQAPANADCMGLFRSAGYNLVGDTSGCNLLATDGDQIGVDPLLGYRVASSTSYYQLAPGSPAMDGGDPTGCLDLDGNELVYDQGWNARPKDGDSNGEARCDIGAAEYNPEKPPQSVYVPLLGRFTGSMTDRFDTPFTNWPIINDDTIYASYTALETYTMQAHQAGLAILVRSPFESAGKTTIEVDADTWLQLNGTVSGYGLVFGIDNTFDNYYIFDINTESQQFELLRVTPGGVETIVAPKKNTAIGYLDAPNHLKVILDGSQVTLEVNDKSLGTWGGLALAGSGTGLISSSYSNGFADVDFDNYKITTTQFISGMAASTFSTSSGFPSFKVLSEPLPSTRK